MKLGKILSNTVIVSCGSMKGTAFFVTPNKLLTAYHIVSDFLYNEPIFIKIGSEEYLCKMEIIKANTDIALLICEKYEHDDSLKLLSFPIQSQLHFSFFGYPDSVLGQSTGIDVEIKINHNYKGLKGDFDAYAVLDDSKSLSVFVGFSGSPVFDDTEEVLGVITQKLDGHIGFVSIKAVEDELLSKGFDLDTEILEHDNAPYGYLENKRLNEKFIIQSGSRYSKDVHIPKLDIDNIFEEIWNLDKFDQCKQKAIDFKNSFDNLCSKINYVPNGYNASLDLYKKNDYSYSCICNSFTQQKFKLKVNQHGNPQLIIEYNRLKNILDDFKHKYEESKRRRSNIFYFKGKAGTGKTHYMCDISSRLIDKTRVYICFGAQFNIGTNPVDQLRKLFNFESQDYLQDLNCKAKERKIRYIIIIDGLNEGTGEVYWKLNLSQLISEINKFDNLALILTIRTPFDRKIGLSETDVDSYILTGFENIQLAKKKYFAKYNIKDDNLPIWIFKNPLFLRIYCQLYNTIPYYKKDQMKSFAFLYVNYIKMRGQEVSIIVDEDEQLHIAYRYLLRLAHISVFDKKCDNITRPKAYAVSKQLAPYRTWSKSLLKAMLDTNLLMTNWNEDSYQDFVVFEYEQMEDFLRAIAFINTKSDKQIKIEKIIELQKWASKHPEQEEQIHNFIVAVSAIWPEIFEEEIISNPSFCEKELVKCYLESIPLHKKKVLESIIEDFWINNEHNIGYEYLIQAFNSINYNLFYTIHKALKQMSLAERDLKWSITVNNQYDSDNISNILSEWAYIELFINREDVNEKKCYVMTLTWMLSSSYPLLRSHIKRTLFKAFKEAPDLVFVTISEFKDVNDPYILEGIYCSVYGTVLISYDKKYISKISQLIFDFNFKDQIPICDITIREWMLKILDRDRYITGSDLFTKASPPYRSYIDIPKILECPADFLGESIGSRKLYESLFDFSDFNRYTIGGNIDSVSRIFTLTPIHNKSQDIKLLPLNIMRKMIANQIKEFGWNDRLGYYDNKMYSENRYSNDTERIGKKYQWIALYNVVAKLMDNYKTCNKWESYHSPKAYPINYPWLVDYHSYFDVTLPISKNNYSLDFLGLNPFSPKEYSDVDDPEWLKSSLYKPELIHFMQGNNNEWILLSTIYSLQDDTRDSKKDLFVRYDSAFVKNSDLSRFENWAKDQFFMGRWMPEYHDVIDHLLFEYPWSTSINKYPSEKWENPINDCPCQIMVSTYSHLQENTQGADDNSGGSQLLPCIDIMEELNLKLVDKRNITFDQDNNPATFYNHDDINGIKGLFIRKDLLEAFLGKNNYTLIYYIIGEKGLFISGSSIGKYEYSACAKYVDGSIVFISGLKEKRQN